MKYWKLLFAEIKILIQEPSILIAIIGGLVFYSFLYPQPYLNEVTTSIPVVVVDLDNSATSREFIRLANASAKVDITRIVHSEKEIENIIIKEEAMGVLTIPTNFEKKIIRGESPNVGMAANASYFLIYSGVMEALTGASAGLSAKFQIKNLLLNGTPLSFAGQRIQSIRYQGEALFNPVMGYASYIIPAAFILILHQTLFLGVGVHTIFLREKKDARELEIWKNSHPASILFTRALVYIFLYLLGIFYYFGIIFSYYGISHLANPWVLIMLSMLLVWTTFCFAITTTKFIPFRENLMHIVLISSIPIIFSTGVMWPVEEIPKPIIWIMQLIPGTSGIETILKVNQMGASLQEVFSSLKILLMLSVLYTLTAYGVIRQWQKNLIKS